MTDQEKQEIKRFYSTIINKALEDQAFKSELLQNPEKAISTLGLNHEEDREWVVNMDSEGSLFEIKEQNQLKS